MVLMTTLYILFVWLIFGKFKLLPLNGFWRTVVLVIGVIIVNVFLAGLGTLTPPSEQAVVSGFVTEIAPQVSGRVTSVPVDPNDTVEPGDTLFRIDPLPYQARVDQLTAQLADTEASVAGMKESYDAARETVKATQAQLDLTELRLRQQEELVAAGAGTQFQLEQYQSQVDQLTAQLNAAQAQENQAYITLTSSVGDEQSRVAQVLAQLESAQFDLANTTVVAPGYGVVTMNVLRPGMYVGPARTVMAFAYLEDLAIGAVFSQKALESTRVGDQAKITFPALPGRVFTVEVIGIPSAIGEAQFFALGQIPRVTTQMMVRSYPIILSLPEDFPPELRRIGLAANARIYTEGAGVVGIVATILQWIQTSMDYVI
jgi:multidrug resistance efflux pump